jgi:hypothetical protein
MFTFFIFTISKHLSKVTRELAPYTKAHTHAKPSLVNNSCWAYLWEIQIIYIHRQQSIHEDRLFSMFQISITWLATSSLEKQKGKKLFLAVLKLGHF